MGRSLPERLPGLLRLAALLVAGIALLGSSISVLANTPGLLRPIQTGGCHCGCAESRLRTGCVKLCDSRKPAFRLKAARCAKPHIQTPTRDSHAGPRFPHPGRAEHARL